MYKKVYFIVFCIVIITLLITMSILTDRLNDSRRLSDRYREQLILAESANREIGARLESCREIAASIRETNERTIRTARDAIELIEELRVKVQDLEDCISDIDWDQYYQYWDDYYYDSGVDSLF